MRGRSKVNSYRDSQGNIWTSDQIERKVRQAKKEKHEQIIDEYGYPFCEEVGCGKNANAGEPIDCSHDISVDKCKNTSQYPLELAWDVNNITLRCRTHHRAHDNL